MVDVYCSNKVLVDAVKAYIDAAGERHPEVKAASDNTSRFLIIFDSEVDKISSVARKIDKNIGRDESILFLNGEMDTVSLMTTRDDGVQEKFEILRVRDDEAIYEESIDVVSLIKRFIVRVLIEHFDIPTVPCRCGKCKPGSQTVEQDEIDAISRRAMELLVNKYHPAITDNDDGPSSKI